MENLGNRFELRDIKQMLLSGNKEQISLAVGRVLSQVYDTELAVEMITSDIPEFLCDAMLPFDSYVSGTIYTCLEIMTQYKYFFMHNHSSFAMETVIRALHFIVKSGGLEETVRQPLNVIVHILQGYARFDVLPEKKPFEDLTNLLMSLLKRRPLSKEVIHQGGLIIKFLFQLELWKVNCTQNLIEISRNWFDLICLKGEAFHSLPEEITNLGCSISEQTLRYLTKYDDVSDQLFRIDEIDGKSDKASVIGRIITFLVDRVAPEVNIVLPSREKQETETLVNFFTSFTYIFHESFPGRNQIAQKLSEMGFIQLIKNILSDSYLLQCEKIGKICVTVLTEILLSLSDDLFQFPDMWPIGRDHFRKELSAGMSLLPLDASRWHLKLCEAEVNRSSRLALIIYFYFYSLTANSTSSAALIYPSATKLLGLPIGINSSALVIKAVWFIFVMSQISQTHMSPTSSSWANKKMLEILESQKEFSLIYTHHPALLYWTFLSSRMSWKIQCETVKSWLENRSSDCIVLDELMKKSTDVRLAVFQLLQDGAHDHAAHLAFSSLKNFMIQSEDDSLSSSTWFLLPQILAEFTTDTCAAVKVDYIVELATLKVPQRPDISKLVRIASLLPEAMQKSDLISVSSAFQLALQLLETSLKYEDNRVLFAFLRCDHFIGRIVNGITTEFHEVAIISLKIVTILWNVKFQQDRLPGLYKRIILNPYELLKILDGNDAELIKMGLLLIEQMLITQFKSLLLIVNQISIEFKRMLIFGLEKVLFKHLPVVSVPAWKCLKHCLEQDKFLIEDCFLHEVTKHGLEYLKETPEMMNFLIVWMNGKMEGERFYEGCTRIKPNYFLETVETVALFLTQNFIEEWDPLCRTILKCCKHFSVDTTREPFKKIAERIAFPY